MKNEKKKAVVLDVIYDIIGSFFYSISIYTFAKMANFAPGGMTGIALILNYLWDFPIGLTTLLLNVPLILLSYKIVGKEFLEKSLKTICISTIFLDVIFPHFPLYTGSQFMAALYSGIFLGIGLALFYMRGSSSGGTDFLTMSIKVLRPHLSIGMITMGIDLLVIFLGWPVFGTVDAVLYGLTATILTSLVIDKILFRLDSGTLIIIISDSGADIAARIHTLIDRGATQLKAMGSYTKEDKDVLLCACSKSQAYLVRRVAHEVDENAFVMITETNEVYGEGFLEPKGKR